MTRFHSTEKSKLSQRAVIILIVSVGGLLRALSMSQYVFMDEKWTLLNVMNFIDNLTVLPVHYNYPTLYSYLATLPTLAWAEILELTGRIYSLAELPALHFMHDPTPILASRATSLAFGVATVYMVFKIGDRFFSRTCGEIAAALLALSGLHVEYSSYALPEATLVFFTACSLYFSLQADRSGSLWDFVMAGGMAGFAAASKYNGALVTLAVVAAFVFFLHDTGRLYKPGRWPDRRALYGFLAFLLCFVAGSPGWLLEPGKFITLLLYESRHMAGGHLGHFGPPYLHHLVLFWRWEKTTALLFGAGILYAFFRPDRKKAIILLFVLVSFFYIGSWKNRVLHYMLVMYPALVLLSGDVAAHAIFYLKSRSAPVTVMLALALLVPPLYFSSRDALDRTRPDARWEAVKWIHSDVPQGSAVVMDWAFIPRLVTPGEKAAILSSLPDQRSRARFKDLPTYNLIFFQQTPEWLRKINADYLVTSSQWMDLFLKNPPPPPDDRQYRESMDKKETYSLLLADPKSMGWEQVKRFDTGKEPRILIYRRIKDFAAGG